MPALRKSELITTRAGSDLRQLQIQYNSLVNDVQAIQQGLLTDSVTGWVGIGPNALAAPLGIGSTDTNLGNAAMYALIQGVALVKAVSNTGTAFGALGTIPADTWGLIAINSGTTGTLTFQSAAANYTTGYATEALAVAALPARLTAVARIGYVTILTKVATQFIVGTDALAGGATGNPASKTNYYPSAGILTPTGVATTLASSPAWSGGKNGIVIPTVLAIGSNDVQISWTAFTYNANGLSNVPKAASTSTAYGALGTIPKDQWGLIALIADGAGTVTFQSAPSNYDSGYQSEALAINALASMIPAAGKTLMGYVTIKTKASTAFIVGTDSPKGGVTGNVASATNYYPTAGITLPVGISAAQIAKRDGTVLTSLNY